MKENAKLIANLYTNESYLRWDNLFNKKTLLGITKTDRLEEVHSLIIRYLLDPDENHQLGTKPLELFMRLLLIKNTNNNILSEAGSPLLLKDKMTKVFVCVPEKTDKRARYDIYIELEVAGTKTTLIIENKVFSLEHNAQTIKYEEYSKYYENPILIYLSNNDEPKSDKFIHITYQDLLDYVIEPLYNFTNCLFTKEILKDYIRVLSHIEIKERSYTLAMSKEEKILLRNVYHENQELFERMLEALTTDDLTLEEKEAYKEAINISKSHRAKWSYKGEMLNSKDLVLTIVKEQLKSGVSIENLSKFKMHSDPLVTLEEKTKDDGYTMQNLNNIVYYVRTCCDLKDVLNLVEKLNIEVLRTEQ